MRTLSELVPTLSPSPHPTATPVVISQPEVTYMPARKPPAKCIQCHVSLATHSHGCCQIQPVMFGVHMG